MLNFFRPGGVEVESRQLLPSPIVTPAGTTTDAGGTSSCTGMHIIVQLQVLLALRLAATRMIPGGPARGLTRTRTRTRVGVRLVKTRVLGRRLVPSKAYNVQVRGRFHFHKPYFTGYQ